MTKDVVQFHRPKHVPGVEAVRTLYRDRQFPFHSHGEYVVGTVWQGTERLEVGQHSYLVPQGQVLLLHPREAHANASVGPAPLGYTVFYIPENSLLPYLCSDHRDRTLHFAAPVIENALLARSILNAYAICSDTNVGPLEQESAMMALNQLLVASSPTIEVAHRGETAAVTRALEWIAAHYRENFGLFELAAAAEVSANRLSHLFKQRVGLSPISFRNQRRIEEAKRLLLCGVPIAAAALDLGFADQSHLTRNFQRFVGTSPKRYLRQ